MTSTLPSPILTKRSVMSGKNTDKPELRQFSWDEVHNHRAEDDCWMVIKGKVYDVTSWVKKHPGGSLILNGAGRDATPMYMSYHPTKVDMILPKYCIGEIQDYSPYYKWDSDFYSTLKQRVEACQKQKDLNTSSKEMILKSVLLLVLWFVFYYLTVKTGNFVIALIWGFWHGHIGIQIGHDGNHGSFSKVKWIQALAKSSMDLMGASSINWEMQHNVGHHPNSNRKGDYQHEDYDPDSKSGHPFIRITPNHPWKPLFRYQHFYIWFLFSIVAFKWLYGDLKALYVKKYQTFEFWTVSNAMVVYSLICKAFFFSYALGVPAHYYGIIHGFILFSCFLISQSYVFVLMFGVNHLTEDSYFPNENSPERDWAKLQVMTSCNFATESRFWMWVSGGLNCQIEHHLFPAISHTYLPHIAPVVKQTCEEFNIPYHTFPDYWTAIRSYYLHIKALGNPEENLVKGG
eukprot:TRINITY_DN821_c0_g1_i1.p1 TRINITY_DN821_c0_g1~~TRINITY_DN821_c0_g1_i1.p1  ORF type:complete len:459 (+),score=74.33 TRINITY_DN821_c0_g1_i1:221-1597(+)